MPLETTEDANSAPAPQAAVVDGIVLEKMRQAMSEKDGVRKVVEENLRLKSDLFRMRNALQRAYDLMEKVLGSPEFALLMQQTQEQDK